MVDLVLFGPNCNISCEGKYVFSSWEWRTELFDLTCLPFSTSYTYVASFGWLTRDGSTSQLRKSVKWVVSYQKVASLYNIILSI